MIKLIYREGLCFFDFFQEIKDQNILAFHYFHKV